MLKHLRGAKRTLNLNVKVTEDEREILHRLARKYADGSISAWVRYAAIKLQPPKADLKD